MRTRIPWTVSLTVGALRVPARRMGAALAAIVFVAGGACDVAPPAPTDAEKATSAAKQCDPCPDENGVDMCCGAGGASGDDGTFCSEYDIDGKFWRSLKACRRPGPAGQRCSDQCLESGGCQSYEKITGGVWPTTCPVGTPPRDLCLPVVCVGTIAACGAGCAAYSGPGFLACWGVCLGTIGQLFCLGCQPPTFGETVGGGG